MPFQATSVDVSHSTTTTNVLLCMLLLWTTTTTTTVLSFTPSARSRIYSHDASLSSSYQPYSSAASNAAQDYLQQLSQQTFLSSSQPTTVAAQSTQDYLNSLSTWVAAHEETSAMWVSTTLAAAELDPSNQSPDSAVASASTSTVVDAATSSPNVVDAATSSAATAVDAITSSAAAPDPPTLSLQDQLSSLSYDSLTTPNSPPSTPSTNFLQTFQDQLATATSSSSPSKTNPAVLSKLQQQLAAQFEALQDVLRTSNAKFVASIQHSQQAALDSLQSTQQSILQSTQASSQKMVQTVSDLSLQQVAEAVSTGLQALGKTLIVLLNIVVETVTNGGRTLPEVVHEAQQAALHVVQGALDSVQHQVHQLGQVTLWQAVQALAQVVVMVTRVLFQILNTILELVTGQGVAAWGQQWSTSLAQAAAQLTHDLQQSATSAATATLADASHSMGHFLEHTTHVMTLQAGAAVEYTTMTAGMM